MQCYRNIKQTLSKIQDTASVKLKTQSYCRAIYKELFNFTADKPFVLFFYLFLQIQIIIRFFNVLILIVYV